MKNQYFFSIEIRILGRILRFGSMAIGKGEKKVDLAVVRRGYIGEGCRLICGDSWENEPFVESIP